jgi:protein TonB
MPGALVPGSTFSGQSEPMEQPLHTLERPSSAQASPRRALGIFVVVAIHVIVIWALITGLAQQMMQKLPSEIMAKVVETPPPVVKLPPPPPPDMVKPPPPFVPPPDIAISNDAPVTNTITTQSVVATPPPAVVKPAGITSPVSIGRPHACGEKYYPPIATRLNWSGTTVVTFKVEPDGSVKDVTIVESSGHDALDQAAIPCAQTFEYKPALQNGQPVESSVTARIRWSLAGG